MMNTQEWKSNAKALPGLGRRLASGQVMKLGSHGGDVRIVTGRVWLTSPGDPSDHVLEAGDSFRVTGAGPTLVETWDGRVPALLDWRPRTLLEHARDELAGFGGRCWELMNPVGRLGIGTMAALVGVLAAALLFGPASEARVRSLVLKPAGASASLLHNADGVAVGATEMRGSPADGHDIRDRSSRPAQEAGRRAPGAA